MEHNYIGHGYISRIWEDIVEKVLNGIVKKSLKPWASQEEWCKWFSTLPDQNCTRGNCHSRDEPLGKHKIWMGKRNNQPWQVIFDHRKGGREEREREKMMEANYMLKEHDSCCAGGPPFTSASSVIFVTCFIFWLLSICTVSVCRTGLYSRGTRNGGLIAACGGESWQLSSLFSDIFKAKHSERKMGGQEEGDKRSMLIEWLEKGTEISTFHLWGWEWSILRSCTDKSLPKLWWP